MRLVALGETDDEGQVQVFFELNGQPRTIKVPNRSGGGDTAGAPQSRGRQRQSSRRADAWPDLDGVRQSGAGGQDRRRLLTIEAMKMETVLHAAKDATVQEILIAAGQSVDAKDLLIVLA